MQPILKLRRALSSNANVEPDDVLAAKTFLQAQGFYEAPDWGVSEIPDRALFSAIEAFQKSKGLRVDGVMKPLGETEQASQLIQAQKLQNLGRNGDTILAHITPAEAMLLKEKGGAGTINPKTGLLEFSGIYANNQARDRAERSAYSGTGSRVDKAGGVGSTSDKDVFSVGNNYFTRDGRRTTAPGESKAREARDRQERVKQAQKIQAKETAVKNKQLADKEHRQEQNVKDEERRARQNANMPDMTDPREGEDLGALGRSNKNKQNRQYAGINFSDEATATPPPAQTNYRPQLPDRTEVYGPPEPSAAAARKGVKISSNPLTKAEVDPSWTSSPDPKVQAQNVVATNDHLEREKQAKLDKAVENERQKAFRRAPKRTFTDIQLKSAARANMAKAKNNRAINDLLGRARANSAQAQAQGKSLTYAQGLRQEIDKIKAENAKDRGQAQNNTAVSAISQERPQPQQTAAVSPTQPQTAEISDKVLGKGIQALNATVKSIDPNKSFSYNELVEATQNILSQNGKTSAVVDFISRNKFEKKISSSKLKSVPKTGGIYTGSNPHNVGWSKEELQTPKYTTSQQIKDTIRQFLLDVAGIDPKDPPPFGGLRG
ncbi:MAG: peptidoglycan-binding protein [Magnetovibrio sp.]|nr:peptidoglycan-binding protein [Magnetovibrio sp.]